MHGLNANPIALLCRLLFFLNGFSFKSVPFNLTFLIIINLYLSCSYGFMSSGKFFLASLYFFVYICNMKKINLLTILFVLISIVGACKKEKRGINFNLYLNQSFSIQNGSPINLPISILLPDVTTNSTAQFEQNDTRAELINSIKLTT